MNSSKEKHYKCRSFVTFYMSSWSHYLNAFSVNQSYTLSVILFLFFCTLNNVGFFQSHGWKVTTSPLQLPLPLTTSALLLLSRFSGNLYFFCMCFCTFNYVQIKVFCSNTFLLNHSLVLSTTTIWIDIKTFNMHFSSH